MGREIRSAALKREERSALYDTIQQGGGNPSDYAYARTSHGAKITHLPSKATFDVQEVRREGGRGGLMWDARWVVGPPGEMEEKGARPMGFPYVLDHARLWVASIERLEGIPDKWAELDVERRAFSAQALGSGENAPFTADEQRQIVDALKKLAADGPREYGLSVDEAHELTTRLDYLADAVSRVGRLDWRNLAAGTFLGAVAGAYLPAETVRAVVASLANAIGHLFGLPLPQLPA